MNTLEPEFDAKKFKWKTDWCIQKGYSPYSAYHWDELVERAWAQHQQSIEKSETANERSLNNQSGNVYRNGRKGACCDSATRTHDHTNATSRKP
jgi:hypothetical protein